MVSRVERLTRDERKAATREALIRAGCDVVRARGFSASVEEIANAAGYTKGAVYSNFEGRVDLLRAIGERVLINTPQELDESAGSLVEAVERGARQLAHFVDTNPERFVLTLDMCVASIREPALREAWRANEPGTKGHPNEWPPGMEPPVDSTWFYIATNGLGLGLAMQRLLYGAETVPDDLFAWAYRQLARSED